MSTELKQTPFAAAYPNGVVEWIDVFGYAVPLTWGDPAVEYHAVRNHAAAMEFSMLLKWDIKGSAAVQTVNCIFSRDISHMEPGQIAYGVVVTESGHMVDDVTVFIHSSEHIRIFGGNPQVGEYIDNHKPANVTVTQRREDLAQLSVQGPASRKILQSLTDSDLSNIALPYYRFINEVKMAGIHLQISRLGFTGELGFEILLPVEQAKTFWDALFNAGQDDGLLPAGAAAVMMCRVESGMIMAELEYDHTMSPYECRMGWSVDLHKVDFQGKEALAAAKEKPSLAVVSVILPEEGEYDGDALSVDGNQVGHVTMAIPSPYLKGQFLGLARVLKPNHIEGTKLDLPSGGQAKIVHTPVYDPDRINVRS
jgi:aminomethyltransferase